MKDSFIPMNRSWCLFAAVLLTAATFTGCDKPVGEFPANEVYSLTLAKSRQVEVDELNQDISAVVDSVFGTPDEPLWPKELIDNDLDVSVDHLKRAAGAVSSERDGTHKGLYREHCVTCHAVAGSGNGAASIFQNPYPRDFRAGVFKWKSTERYAKPTRDDLANVLVHGAAGSGMPSFALVGLSDREALVDYVIYLSVRGQVERELMQIGVDEFGYGVEPLAQDERMIWSVGSNDGDPTTGDLNNDDASESTSVIKNVVSRVTQQWADADSQVVEVPPFAGLSGSQLQESIARGESIFHGQIANCVGCHGKTGQGGVETLDYDDWTKEYSTRIGLTPGDRDAMRPMKKAGALTPRQSKPRQIASGVFRGGSDPSTLYRRIAQGIAGTPMPAVKIVQQEDGTGLTESQVQDLVRYVRSLSDGADMPALGLAMRTKL